MDDEDYAQSSASSEHEQDDNASLSDDGDSSPRPNRKSAKRVGFKPKAPFAHGRATRGALAAAAAKDAPAAPAELDVFGIPRSRWDTYDPDECWLCRSERVGVQLRGQIVYCDSCSRGFHQRCYGSPLMHGVPPGLWYCKECNGEKRDAVDKRDAEGRLLREAIAAMPAALRGDRDVLQQYPVDDDMPFNDPFDEAGPSEAYRAWAIRRLRSDASFMVLWDWLEKFGEAAGIAPVTFAKLEAAFVDPGSSALLTEVHVAVLHAMGKASVDARTWPKALWRVVDEEYDVEFRDAMRLNAKLQRALDVPGICRRTAEAVNAAAPAAVQARAAAPKDDDVEEEEHERNYLALPILVRTRLLQLLCEELLTCSHKANQKIMTLLEEAGGAASETVELDAMHDNEMRVFVTPLYTPGDFVGLPLSAPDTHLISTVRHLTAELGEASTSKSSTSTSVPATPASPLRAASRTAAMLTDGDEQIIAIAQGVTKQPEDASSSSCAPATQALDDRCIEYMFFQDSDGDLRLVRSRRNLPPDSVPRNPTVRSMIVSRLTQRVVNEKAKEAARAGMKRSREEARSSSTLDGSDPVKKDKKEVVLKDAGANKPSVGKAASSGPAGQKKKRALTSATAAATDGKKQMSLSSFLFTPKPSPPPVVASPAPVSTTPIPAPQPSASTPAADTTVAAGPSAMLATEPAPAVIDVTDDAPVVAVATTPAIVTDPSSVFNILMKQPKKPVSSEALLQPMTCDGVVYVRVPRTPVAMRCDFETVATTLEELKHFVRGMADSASAVDKALASSLTSSALEPATAALKYIQQERRQQAKKAASEVRRASSGSRYATRGRRVVVYDVEDDEDDDDVEGDDDAGAAYVPRPSSSRGGIVAEVS